MTSIVEFYSSDKSVIYLEDPMSRRTASSSLEVLIENTSPWASDWDEVLLYLRGPGLRNPSFSVNDVIGLIEEIRALRDENFPYTTSIDKIREKIHS